MRFCLLMLAAASLLAQGPATTVSISAPRASILSADSMQLAATPRDANGIARLNDNIVWTSGNTNVLEVTPSGAVTGRALGHADVTAAVGNVRSTIRIQVLPQRIDVSPVSADLIMGQTQTYTAAAKDAKGDTIANAVLEWQVLNASGNVQNSAVISAAGVFRATVPGQFTIRATSSYNAGPGFLTQYSGTARIRVTPPADYTLKRLISSTDLRENPRLRFHRGTLAAVSADEVWFPASLDGAGAGHARWRGGAIEVMAAAGIPSPTSPGAVSGFSDAAAGGNGVVLLRALANQGGPGLLAFDAAGPRWVHADNSNGGGSDAQTNAEFTPFSFPPGAGNAFLFRANLRVSGSEQTVSGLLRRAVGGESLLLFAASDPVSTLARPVTLFSDGFGMDAAGNIYFRASDATGRQAILKRDNATGQVSELTGTGRALAGSTVRTVHGGYSPAVGADGAVTAAVQLSDNRNGLARWRPGAAAAEFLEAGYNNLWASTAGAGTLFTGTAPAGNGLHWWRTDGRVETLLVNNRPGALGEPVTAVWSAASAPDGTVFASVSGVETPWMIARFSGAEQRAVVKSGAIATGTAAPAMQYIVRGDRSGGLHLMMGGPTGSIFAHTRDGLLPMIMPGDRLPGGVPYVGDWTPRKSPASDLYLTAGSAIYRISGDAVTRAVSFPLSLENGVLLNANNPLSVSGSGSILLSAGTNLGHNRIAIYSAGAVTTLAMYGGNDPAFQTPLPGGGIADGFNELVMNENLQVLGLLRARNGPNGLYLWDNGAWTEVCVPGRCTMFGGPVSAMDNLQAAGEYLYARFHAPNGRRTVARWSKGQWLPLLGFGDPLPNAAFANNFSLLDANGRGDALLWVFDSGGSLLVVNERGQKTVLSMTRLTEDGDLIRTILGAELRDDGRVHFLALDYFDRVLCYVALSAQ
jgi:hypothetical protein